MAQLILVLATAFLLATGCISYKKALQSREVVDNNIQQNKVSLKNTEDILDTSAWKNKKVTITDVEFYRNDSSSVAAPKVVAALSGSDSVAAPLPVAPGNSNKKNTSCDYRKCRKATGKQ